jgi:hypothetical protein
MLKVGKYEYDVSNLHSKRGKPRTSRQRKSSRLSDTVLYPNSDDLRLIIPETESAEAIFSRIPIQRSSFSTNSFCSQSTLSSQSKSYGKADYRSVPGAYHAAAPPQQRKSKPPLPTWVGNSRTEVEDKCIERTSRQPYSYTLEPPIPSFEQHSYGSGYYSVQPIRSRRCSSISIGSDAASIPESLCEDERRAPPRGSRPHIEVSPGHFMELRGSSETMQALEGGYAVTVTCVQCQIRIKCVPDCELVICPDCRVMSPLYQTISKLPCPALSEYGYNKYDHHSQYGDVKVSHRPSSRVGGVGLGLKVDYDW